MNIQSLAEILREAAAIIHAVPISAQPGNMRQPIVDELEGFASWVEQGCVNRAEYDELLSQLEAVGAGGVNGRLMPGSVSEALESARWRNALVGLCDTDRIDTPEQAITNVKRRMRPMGIAGVRPVAFVEGIDPVALRATIRWPWVQNGVLPQWLNVGASLYAAPVSAEPVAVVGADFTLLWAGAGPIAPLVQRHGLKVGSQLYATPVAAQGVQPCQHRFMHFGDQKRRRCADCCMVEPDGQEQQYPGHPRPSV